MVALSECNLSEERCFLRAIQYGQPDSDPVYFCTGKYIAIFMIFQDCPESKEVIFSAPNLSALNTM